MTPRYLPGGHGLTWKDMTTMPNNYIRIRHTCARCGRGINPERPRHHNLCPCCVRREVYGEMRKDKSA